MRLPCLFLIVSIFFNLSTLAQTSTTLRVSVRSNDGEALSFATVLLVPQPDTTNRKWKTTDSLGLAMFEVTINKPYRLRISAVNYESKTLSFVGADSTHSIDVILNPDKQTLAGVTVRSRRPLMRQEDDKIIVDPEPIAATSASGFEVMEKIPGLFIDPDGNIYIASTTPAQALINGREMRLPAADMASLLKSLPPTSIQSIEILRTPSARYDAASAGGVVNVILKKGVRIGLNGSLTTGFNQGKFGNRFGGASFNYTGAKLTTYLYTQYTRSLTYERIESGRRFRPDSILAQEAYTRFPGRSFYLGYGASYAFDSAWEISYDGRVSINHNDNRADNRAYLQDLLSGNRVLGRLTETDNRNRSSQLSQNFNLNHRLDSAGSEWTTDLTAQWSPGETAQNFSIFTPLAQGMQGRGDIDNHFVFLTAQSSLVKKWLRKTTFEAGVKTSNVRFRNATLYENLAGSIWEKDASRTAAYRYREGIHALYAQASKTWQAFTAKGGVRLENTNMTGTQQVPSDTSFSIRRTDLFPYLYLSRPFARIMGYSLRSYLVYRRSISRPGYAQLNPAIRFVDPFLIETGNPALRPQLTDNYEFNVSFDEQPVFALGINESRDVFTQVVYGSDTNSKLNLRTYDNLGRNRELYFRLVGAVPPGGKYFGVIGTQYNQNNYRGIYEGAPLAFSRGTWTIFTYQTLKLNRTTNFSINGYVRFRGQQQFYELSTFGVLRSSLSKQFFNKKLTVSITGEDLLYTNRNRFNIAQGSVQAFGERRADTRRFGLNIRYNFGLKPREDRQQSVDTGE